jgi:predicted HTH domain antitoxin
MSAITVTKADLWHIANVLEWATWVSEEYPELLNKQEEEELAIANQLIEEKMV